MALENGLEIVDGPPAGAWIKPEMTGEGGSVTGNVPARFESYLRILHPATDKHDKPVTWGQVASELGRTVHPLAQWDAIVGANRYRNEEPDWPGHEPEWGALPIDTLAALCEVLAPHTATPDRCFYALWMSHWNPPHRMFFVSRDYEAEFEEPPPPKPAFSAEELSRPTLEHGGGREYRVIRGPLRLAPEVPEAVMSDMLSPITPNMIWPEDRAWFLASEIDFDSTLIGGSKRLARTILDDDRFEAFAVGADDLLTCNADRVNPPLEKPDDW